ncbi:MAG: CLC_0170 family protein [Clostridia bacterium]
MLLGMGIGVFCFFVDGNIYKKKGLKKEQIAAKVTGVLYFLFSILLFILVTIF